MNRDDALTILAALEEPRRRVYLESIPGAWQPVESASDIAQVGQHRGVKAGKGSFAPRCYEVLIATSVVTARELERLAEVAQLVEGARFVIEPVEEDGGSLRVVFR